VHTSAAASATLPAGRLGVKCAVVVVLLLALVTFLGTLASAREGVLAARLRFFEAYVAWAELPGGWSLPLPGARLLLWLALVTLLLDRAAWSPRQGRRVLIVVHAAVAALLACTLLAPRMRPAGNLWLPEGEVVTTFVDAAGASVRLPFGLRLLAHDRTFHPRTRSLAGESARVEVVADGELPITAEVTPLRPLRRDGWTIHLPASVADLPTALGATRLVALRGSGEGAWLPLSILLACGLGWHFARMFWDLHSRP